MELLPPKKVPFLGIRVKVADPAEEAAESERNDVTTMAIEVFVAWSTQFEGIHASQQFINEKAVTDWVYRREKIPENRVTEVMAFVPAAEAATSLFKLLSSAKRFAPHRYIIRDQVILFQMFLLRQILVESDMEKSPWFATVNIDPYEIRPSLRFGFHDEQLGLV